MAKYQEWLSEDGLLSIESWARDGLSNTQIAYNMGITRGTLEGWAKKFEAIGEALRKGKRPVDLIVENAAFLRATGQWVEETETIIDKVSKADKDPRIRIIKRKRYIPPDTTACIYWLKNRKREQWNRLPEAFEVKNDLDNQKAKLEVEKLQKELAASRDDEKFEITIIDSWDGVEVEDD